MNWYEILAVHKSQWNSPTNTTSHWSYHRSYHKVENSAHFS